MKKSTKAGEITPFMFDNIPVRGMVLRLENLEMHVPSLSDASDTISKSLSELLAASATLVSDIDPPCKVTLQIHSKSPVSLMVAQCSDNGNMRAFAEHTEDGKGVSFEEIVEKDAVFAVTVEQGKEKRSHQSLIALNQTSVSSSVEQYFNDSVQLDTFFKVFNGKQETEMHVGALFIQKMPSNIDISDDWRRIALLLGTLEEREILPGDVEVEALLLRLFSEKDQIRVFPKRTLSFTEGKSREKMSNALKNIGKDECRSLLKKGKIEMTDEFTGHKESFDEADLRNIFGTAWEEE